MNAQSQQVSGQVLPGLANPVFDATNIFRQVMQAMAHPGRVYDIPAVQAAPDGLQDSTTAVLLTLADMETAIWLAPGKDNQQAREFIGFHCTAPVTDLSSRADFAVMDFGADMSIPTDLRFGEPEYPDRSATLIIQVDGFGAGPSVRLTGPGIKDSQEISAPCLTPDFVTWFNRNRTSFPCGIDVILAAPGQIIALPRSVKMEIC